MNGDLPPEVWAEREVAATLNLNDLGSESRAVELVVQPRGALSVLGDRTHALTSEGADASEDGTGRGTPIITVSNDSAPQVEHGMVGALKVGTGLGLPSAPPALTADATVRRLTPRECERLQGFPDDWTLTSNGKPQADSARYRQMGNAVAVPVFDWVIGRVVWNEENL